MSNPGLRRLASELGGSLPTDLGALQEKDVGILHKAFTDARLRQKHEMDDALSRALDHVPALMRRPIRKILGI